MSAFSALLARYEAPTCSILWIKRILGHKRPGDASLVRFVELLIEEQGFPKPLPHYQNGGKLETGVTARSEWLRAAVEAWLEDNFFPPAAAALLEHHEETEAAAAMDAAALTLARPKIEAANDLQVAA